jgi:hypothetical protein
MISYRLDFIDRPAGGGFKNIITLKVDYGQLFVAI